MNDDNSSDKNLIQMMTTKRLHVSAEDLKMNYLSPNRALNSMASISTQEPPFEGLEYGILMDLLQELQNGFVRKPDHLNNIHFLLLLLYDAHGYPRDRYPLWRWYYRIKKKLVTSKHLTVDTDSSRECILKAIEYIIDSTPTMPQLLDESVQLEQQYLNSPIHGLFKSYTPLHTYLYMEHVDKPILNDHNQVFSLFQTTILTAFRYEHCDLIHFAIAHRKTNLLSKIFGDKINWIDVSMNLITNRGWSPLHYAAYVGDKETVKTICDTMTSTTSSSPHFDVLSLLIPAFQQHEFGRNPSEYILKACGFERDAQQTRQRKHGVDTLRPSMSTSIAEKYREYHDGQGAKDQPSLAANNTINNNLNQTVPINTPNDNDIPDADELELSSLPLIHREEFIDKIIYGVDSNHMLIPSPLTLACLATCGDKVEYEEIVKLLLDSHLVQYDGLSHECILTHVLDYMYRNEYATFQHVQVYRDTEIEGPPASIFYQFDGFIVNQDIKPLSNNQSGSTLTLNTSKNDESVASDDGHLTETPVSVRGFLTVLVLRDMFLQYPRWDFHLLRENIEEHFSELETALGYRPTILYPDGDVISSRKRSDITWEVKVKYRLNSETGQSLYMEIDYCFFESFGDPFADALVNIYQTPFYISCMTDSTVMMHKIFDSFFKRRNLIAWGTIAQKHLEHCFDGVLQIKNNFTTFLELCTILARYYQIDGDPFIEENSATIQRIFVHAFACCVRRNAKVELEYLIKNHALIYYDSCRTKPSDIRHNILTYCVVRNLANAFDQLMTNMKTTMYKTYQNSTNPDWQPHIAWREIIHVIIDPLSQQQQGGSEQNDFTQLACYGDTNTNFASIGSVPILHATGDEYNRCISARNNIILKAKKKLPRISSDISRTRPRSRRLASLDQQQISDVLSQLNDVSTIGNNNLTINNNNNTILGGATSANLTKKSRNIFKNVHRLRWKKSERQNSPSRSSQQQNNMHKNSPTVTTGLDELTVPKDTISLVSNITL